MTGRQSVGGVVETASGATITGVRTIWGIAIKANITRQGSWINERTYVGGIIGSPSGEVTTIQHVYNKATVTGNSFIGGIVGFIDGDTNLQFTYNTGELTSMGINMNLVSMGGIVGHITKTGIISQLYNAGPLLAFDSTIDMGGIIGRTQRWVNAMYLTDTTIVRLTLEGMLNVFLDTQSWMGFIIKY